MNFASRRRRIPVAGRQIVLSTHDAFLEGGHVVLPARAGAVVR